MGDGEWHSRNRVRSSDNARRYSQTERGKEVARRATAKYRKTVIERTQKMINEIKAKPCMDCDGTFDPVCMDFDHRPGEVKRFSVSEWRNWRKRVSVAGLLAEIAKCDLVCANCHRIRTYRRRDHRDTQNRPTITSPTQLSLLDDPGEGDA